MNSIIRKLGRFAVVLLLSCPVTACAFVGGSDLQSLRELAKRSIFDDGVSLVEAASTPYASIGVRVGSSNEVMLVLATDTNGELLWTSSARIAILTEGGRVVRTSGLKHDLSGFTLQKQSKGANGEMSIQWLADFPDANMYSVPISCESRPAGNDVITILGRKIATRRIDETCRVNTSRINWNYENTYWVTPSNGQILRSIQHINPYLDPLEITVLRSPA